MNGYLSSDVCRLSGATYRSIDYWARQGRLGDPHAPGSGGRRRFSFAELVLVRAYVVLNDMVATGVSLPNDLYLEIYAAVTGPPIKLERNAYTDLWLVVSPKGARVVPFDDVLVGVARSALVVDLERCAIDVTTPARVGVALDR